MSAQGCGRRPLYCTCPTPIPALPALPVGPRWRRLVPNSEVAAVTPPSERGGPLTPGNPQKRGRNQPNPQPPAPPGWRACRACFRIFSYFLPSVFAGRPSWGGAPHPMLAAKPCTRSRLPCCGITLLFEQRECSVAACQRSIRRRQAAPLHAPLVEGATVDGALGGPSHPASAADGRCPASHALRIDGSRAGRRRCCIQQSSLRTGPLCVRACPTFFSWRLATLQAPHAQPLHGPPGPTDGL